MHVLEISCAEVRRELSNYMDAEITAELRVRIEEHVNACDGCRALYDGVKNVITLVGSSGVLELPTGFSQRLYRRVTRQWLQ